MKVVYVAGPFRSVAPNGAIDAWGIQANVMRAMGAALEVWKMGAAALCPHANTMFFQNAAGLADRVWLDGDLELLRRCDAVLMVDGWRASVGAMAERTFARSIGLPVFERADDLRAWLQASR